MCDRDRCAMCGKVKLGLPMEWEQREGEVRQGHVCYGCEDLVCNEIAAGTTDVRWVDSVGKCA
jgi:hypothetical protein